MIGNASQAGRLLTLICWFGSLPLLTAADGKLVLPAVSGPIHAQLSPPTGWTGKAGDVCTLSTANAKMGTLELVPASGADGLPRTGQLDALVSLPASAKAPQTVAVRPGTPGAKPVFRFDAVNEKALGLWEADRPVFVYNHGVQSKPGVPANRNRSTYIHPLYALNGEVLTDDFPKDHYHHRGLFWAWPHVRIEGKHYDLWAITGIVQRFERWLVQHAGSGAAVLAMQNGWYVGDRKQVEERVWIRAYPASEQARAIDLEFTWIPIEHPLTLAGAEGKSYGGLTLRFAPRTDTVITTPQGQGKDDLHITRLPWADLSAQFGAARTPMGASIFIAPSHPDYPPEWLTRHYGVLCVGWPGVQAQTFPAGKPIRCQYRVWVHADTVTPETVKAAYASYLAQKDLRWE